VHDFSILHRRSPQPLRPQDVAVENIFWPSRVTWPDSFRAGALENYAGALE
jgi:hypothetical protein